MVASAGQSLATVSLPGAPPAGPGQLALHRCTAQHSPQAGSKRLQNIQPHDCTKQHLKEGEIIVFYYRPQDKYAFQEALNSAGDKLVVVDFSAAWCGPCKMIKPFFHSLSEKYSNVVFLEIDVDDCQDVAAECEVKCMPTFQFFKKGQKVGEFSGANKEKLEATINEFI
ncbi:Thioredoxin [Myotis brandtii]|uniref:Thioredoxin n=1 Tax=Myotis brandtii TaxID=109478 RepID=S7MH24_MYOBR|nr:Thioredoxin [Myotis brandtii]